MATTLKLTGVQAISGGVLDLNGANSGMGSVALLPGWRPRVAARPRGTLGNKSMPLNVTESIPLRVYGTTEQECITTLETLAAAMNQAAAWRDGAAVDPVLLNYAINNTALSNPLQTAVLGTPLEANDILGLPVSFNQNLQVFEVNPLELELERRGLWLADEESQVSSSTAENPTINTASFTGALLTPSPVKLNIEFTNGNGHATETGTALAFIADDADKLYLATELVGSTSGSSTVTDSHADADASANEVLQIVPNDTAEILIQPNIDGTFPNTPGSHVYMFFLVLQNLSTSVYWDIYQLAYFRPGSAFTQTKALNSVRITADNNSPQIVSIGPLVFDHPISLDASGGTQPAFYIRPSAGSGAGHELEIDTIAIVELGAGMTALTLRGLNFNNSDNQVVIDHALLTRLKPSVVTNLISGGASEHSIDYEGLPLIFNNTAEIAALVLGIQDNNWLLGHEPVSTFAPVSVGVKATRRPAYLVPR